MAMTGLAGLTDRQSLVAQLLADGLLDKQIAARIGVSRPYVSQVVNQIVVAWALDPTGNARVLIARRVIELTGELTNDK